VKESTLAIYKRPPGWEDRSKNPREKQIEGTIQVRCVECERRFMRPIDSEGLAKCPICDPAPGTTGWICHYCRTPFAQADGDQFICCSAGCEWLYDVGDKDARNWSHPPVQPWEEIPREADPDAGELNCIECGAVFVPNFGRGRTGSGGVRKKCFKCSPAKARSV